ncbi:type I-D CRISPR-associated endonuclease Cas1 [Methylacidiphilum caldifontis]|nr:type I-D CRISPR-associated endonuclease Cas1 [Methylacidiphilum caldifontis]
MSTLHVTLDGSVLRKVDERLKVTIEKETVIDVPLIKIDQVIIWGRVTVTPDTVKSLLEHKIEIVYLTTYGKYVGRIQPEFSKNSILRKAQYRASEDKSKATCLCRSLVYGKLSNMRTILLRGERFNGLEGKTEEAIERIRITIAKLKDAASVDEIRGYEGAGSAAYFSVFGELIKADGFSFEGREKRPPTDPLNALLSLGYVLLTNDMHTACSIVGFDPYIGFLHSDKHGKPSLALDMVEEFRPVIVDSLVLSLINKRVIQIDDFDVEVGNVYKLKDTAFKKFLQYYEEKKRTEIKHPLFDYKASYMRSFELQARLLGKFVSGEIEEYIPFLIK